MTKSGAEEPIGESARDAEDGLGGDARERSSPYATGGGGVTFERRVAALYLALLLTGDTAGELGDGREVRVVAFQQAPRTPVDDLVVEAALPAEADVSLELAIAVRHRPNLVRSNPDSQKLVTEFVRAVRGMVADGRERRLALVVAGRQQHPEQLGELAALARNQRDTASFYELVDSGRYRQQLRGRLKQLGDMVKTALSSLDVADPDESAVRDQAWELLRRLWVLMPDVEEPTISDWIGAQNRLRPVAAGGDLAGAGALLDRLEVLAGQYALSAATIDRPVLRRAVHALIDDGRQHHRRAWELVDLLQGQARAVADRIGDDGTELHLDRGADCDRLIAATEESAAVIVTGESGVGKSAVAVAAASSAVASADGDLQAIVLNLRHLPDTAFELTSRLGAPLEVLLTELSAPRRLLMIDGADAANEGKHDLFTYLVDAARKSDTRLVAVTSGEAVVTVRDLLVARLGADVVGEQTIPALNDAQLVEVGAAFPNLSRLVADPRSRELLRRLVVVDLLVRSGVPELPLSDLDAMRQVWLGLVRKHGRRDRGLPDAREQVFLQLASHELSPGPAAELAAQLEPTAVDGLRRDGLIRDAAVNPWQVLPEFGHDELRRYAVARVLLADGTPGRALMDVAAPRWALSAARLACQGALDPPNLTPATVAGRFMALQRTFDELVEAGYGARWADIPTEALLTLGDPRPLIADAWGALREGEAAGLRRLLRLIDQRHRNSRTGLVDVEVVEPVIELLLDDPAPWRHSEDSAALLRQWLVALVIRDEPAGHELRTRLHARLVGICQDAERRLEEQQAATAAARAARVPDDAERERERLVEGSDRLFAVLGRGGRARRQRPPVPRELTDDTILELLALLGPDLGGDGEQLLRRVACDAPADLAPAVDEAFTGRALGSYGHGLLADLVEAYYLDDDEDGSGFDEDRIRRHDWRGPITPMFAWYRGPFYDLWQTDFRRGIVVLNRLLNHAARARIRTLARIGDPWARLTDDDIAGASVEMSISGQARHYVGDSHVWCWYRGTGVGPYPCMSALQALERFCDQVLSLGIAPSDLLPLLFDGCENLAMPALVVGLLVRHLERAGSLLDPYLAEPMPWRLEIARVVSEAGGFGASSEGLIAPDRRRWSLQEAASWLTIHADPTRADELRAIGDRLVARAAELEGPVAAPADTTVASPEQGAVSLTTTARNWASTLDRSRYGTYRDGEVIVFQSSPLPEVAEALRPSNDDLRRGQEANVLLWRHAPLGINRHEPAQPPTAEQLADDAIAARGLFESPPTLSAVGVWDMAAAVAASVLTGALARALTLPDEATCWALSTILAVAEGAAPPNQFEYEASFYAQGADRSAARAIPLLLLPSAERLRHVAGHDSTSGEGRVTSAGFSLAHAVADETRLFLARGLDPVWRAPCAPSGRCHHELGLNLAVESMRDCAFGDRNSPGQRREIERLADPVTASLAELADDAIFVSRLDAAIRATGAAAVSQTCVRDRARELLLVLLAAQRRALLAHGHHFDERGSHALVAARALLDIASAGDGTPLREHVRAYADDSTALGSLLRALAAAAEENQTAAAAARAAWPGLMSEVLDLQESGHRPFGDRYFGTTALASLVPTPTYEAAFLYREVDDDPVRWEDPLAWAAEIDAWIVIAEGKPKCVDAMIGAIKNLSESDQVQFGLPRVSTLVRGDIDGVCARSYLLDSWLTTIRSAAADAGALSAWQELVDALVVAGDTTLASYSD